ncbi:hypothetical protein AB1Y20_008993 [Prymnesium parvum]|uniref:Hexosyltransferase n=1 Tax=Prymnesium parvum TaxID=97485 RepID=A0AB34K2Z8_PRYPA
MRAWYLLLLTVVLCLLLLIREVPGRREEFVAPASNGRTVELVTPSSQAPSSTAHRGTRTLAQDLSMIREPAPDAALSTSTLPPRPVHASPPFESTSNASLPGTSRVITVASSSHATPAPFIALGIVSNCMWPPPPKIQQQADRRKWIRATFLTYPNIGKSMAAKFVVGMLRSNLKPLPRDLEAQLREEASSHTDMLLLENVPERKSPCLKTMAWYRYAVHAFPGATFIAKTDDDAYVQTVKLEVNMRPFVGQRWVYIGSTLWGSFITNSFEPCARRLGPMMASSGMLEEKCKPRGAIGPYPYAVGMLQVLSRELAAWMVAQEAYATFERRATAAIKTPMMEQGEDMVIGMFIYLHPEPIMPLHWGWDKLHDLCFVCTRKDQIWRPITHQTVVAHHVANEDIINEVHRNISERCGASCVSTLLPFEVKSLEDLCSRGQISKVYSKCAAVRTQRE